MSQRVFRRGQPVDAHSSITRMKTERSFHGAVAVAPQRCKVCVPALVDSAVARCGAKVSANERFQLIAALLGRRHLLLDGADKAALSVIIKALAEEMADGNPDVVCALPGHPWWASDTERCGYFADMQESVATWRLCYFLADVLAETSPSLPASQPIICVQSMSVAEVQYYFEFLAQQFVRIPELAKSPVTIMGAYQGVGAPELSAAARRLTAVVQLGAGG